MGVGRLSSDVYMSLIVASLTGANIFHGARALSQLIRAPSKSGRTAGHQRMRPYVCLKMYVGRNQKANDKRANAL